MSKPGENSYPQGYLYMQIADVAPPRASAVTASELAALTNAKYYQEFPGLSIDQHTVKWAARRGYIAKIEGSEPRFHKIMDAD